MPIQRPPLKFNIDWGDLTESDRQMLMGNLNIFQWAEAWPLFVSRHSNWTMAEGEDLSLSETRDLYQVILHSLARHLWGEYKKK